jgi:glycosyltransferase involved in cell wall biosynthesis
MLSRGLWKWIGKGIQMADLVTAPSEFAAQAIRDRFRSVSVQVISNGVRRARIPEPMAFCQHLAEPFRALYVGRLQREKRVDELLYALKGCLDAGIVVDLTIVGDGPDRRRLERTVRRISITEHVDFAGIVSDDRRDFLYAQSHFLWMASRDELQCCAALESMAAARPVVAARASALPETVPDRIAGRLYDPGEVTQIASIMSEFRSVPDLYYRLCRGAAAVAARHSSSESCLTIEKAYSSLVNHGESGDKRTA